jgi:hypothetical protein
VAANGLQVGLHVGERDALGASRQVTHVVRCERTALQPMLVASATGARSLVVSRASPQKEYEPKTGVGYTKLEEVDMSQYPPCTRLLTKGACLGGRGRICHSCDAHLPLGLSL